MTSLSPTRLICDLNAYAHNLQVVRNYIPEGCDILAVVKADGYGHGAVPIAKRAVAEGVRMLGVATVDEGLALREAGIEAPILVMVQPSGNALSAAIKHNLRLMISDAALGDAIGEQGRKSNRLVHVHCKVDCGMGRQGFSIADALNELVYLTRIPHVDVEGVAVHFPTAERPNDSLTEEEIKMFRQFIKQLDKGGIPYEMAHAARSAAIINYPSSAFDMVRPGLMTYGLWPTDTPPLVNPLKPVARWETRVVLVKEFEPGSSIGYGRTYTTSGRMRGALLPVGYADGYCHSLSNKAEVLIRGVRCPVRGSVCMDQIVVEVSHLPEIAVGDVATLVGSDGLEQITFEELARHAQTLPYELLTGLGPRVQREYIN